MSFMILSIMAVSAKMFQVSTMDYVGFFHYYEHLVADNLIGPTEEILSRLEFANMEFLVPFIYFLCCFFVLLFLVLFNSSNDSTRCSLMIYGFLIVTIYTLLLLVNSV